METFLVENLDSFATYIEVLLSFKEFGSNHYPITAPVASIEVDFFKIERAKWGTVEEWTSCVERAYELGGGVCHFQSACMSSDSISLKVVESVIVSQRKSSNRNTLRELSMMGSIYARKISMLLELEAFSLTGLIKLDLSKVGLRDGELALVLVQISMAADLETLVLDSNDIGKQSIEVLCSWIGEASCPLKCLSVRNCGLGARGGFDQLMECLGNAPSSKLSELHTEMIPLGAGIGEVLSAALLYGEHPAPLRSLSLDKSRFSRDNEDVTVLAKLLRNTKLKTLSISECALKDEQFVHFLDVMDEEEGGKTYGMNIGGLALNDQELIGRFISLSQSRLRELDITNLHLGVPEEQRQENLERLFYAIGRSATIETLNATAVYTCRGLHLEALMKGMLGPDEVVSKLSRLVMDHNPIGPKSMGIAAMYIARKPTHPLRHLSFCSCLGGVGYDTLFKVLKKDKAIETLSIAKADALEVEERGGESLPPSTILPKYEPLDLTTRYAVLTALAERETSSGRVQLRFAQEIYRSIFAFSLRPLKRRVFVK